MAIQDLDSFLHKFKHLWHCGFDAHLDVDTHAGEAWVGLRVRLGQNKNPTYHQKTFLKRNSRESPSKQRRRDRRAALREEQADVNQAESENVKSPASKESESVDTTLNENEIGAIDEEFAAVEAVEAEAVEAEVMVGENILFSVIENTVEETLKEKESLTVEVLEDVIEKNPPEPVVVWTTGVFDTSPKEYINQNDFISLENVLRTSKHLNENIIKIEPLEQSNRKFKFKHTLGLKFIVKTDRL